MKKKFYVIFVTLLMCLSAIVIISNDFEVEATGGSGNNSLGLDYDYIWFKILDNLTYVVHNDSIWGAGDEVIRKGRSFGTEGDNWTANYIRDELENLDLSNVQKLKLGPIEGYDKWEYTSKVEVVDFNLTINSQNWSSLNFTSDGHIPKNETFVLPSARINRKKIPLAEWLKMSYNNTFENVKLISKNLEKSFILHGATTNDYLNISDIIILNVFDNITGNATHITNNQTLPEDQEGRVFLFEEENGCENQLDNMTNASGAILIHNNTQGGSNYYTNYNFSNITVQCARVNKTNSNLTTIIEKLENDTIIIMDNTIDNQTLTFLHNFAHILDWWPTDDFLILGGDNTIINIYFRAGEIWGLNPVLDNLLRGWCHGFILYENYQYNDNVHIMDASIRYWMGRGYGNIFRFGLYFLNQPAVQIFTVNKSVGNFLESNISDCTISGYFEQKYIKENHDNWTAGVDAYNVEGNITIDQSPDDKIIILEARPDSWWGECPGDSGAGVGIMMGIAKYIKDNNLKPKYNLTFLFTTGEEYSMRGEWHYSHSHPEDKFNIIRWIGADQLGYIPVPGTSANLSANIKNYFDYLKVNNIMSKSDYYSRTGYDNSSEWITSLKSGQAQTNDVAWIDRCKTIVFSKSGGFKRHHRAGMNYEEGDSMKNMDRNDTNVTFEVIWNVTKYYCFNPDCWFKDISFTPYDSNSDSVNDSVNVTFTVNTSFPHDRVMVKAVLFPNDHSVLYRLEDEKNYIITNTSNINDTFSFKLTRYFPEGNYSLKVYLFNSTGEVDNDVFNPFEYGFLNKLFANVTFETEFYLHPPNSAPDTPSRPWGDTNVENKGFHSYTTITNDSENDSIWYQWRWNLSENGNYHYTMWILGGPYESGLNASENIWWTHPGDYQLQVRAKDVFINPNVKSDWSPPLNVTVTQSNGWSSWNSDLLDTFSSTELLPEESTSCNGFAEGVFIESISEGSLSWNWSFGDGAYSEEENAVHYYSSVGNYTVNLTITDGDFWYNCTTNVSVLILKANFSTSDVLQPNVTIFFNDTSGGYYNITNWTWDFGDGNMSYQQNTTHTYPVTGAYNVSLTVQDEEDNSHTHYKNIFVESVPSDFVSVECSPAVAGYGSDVDIFADFFDNQSMVNSVIVNMVYPDNSSENFTMSLDFSIPYDYMLVFNDTWQVGEYNYSVYVVDNAGNVNCTSGFNFTVSSQANISVCTNKDEYGDNENIYLTDPPSEKPLGPIDYELMDNGSVLRLWNRFDSYYFNTSNGLQFTNHFNKYWSHNVLMLGYYNNEVWNLVYRVDELSGFNKNIVSDNETFVNVTLWKDLSFGVYDFRLAIRYYLGVDDNELTVIPYIKNLGVEIPFVLGFTWELKDIQVDMTPGGDYIEINGTSYYLNQSLDETYEDLTNPCFDIREDISNYSSESLYLRWDENLDYKIQVKSRDGQYNSPVTLGIKIGTLNVDQEKYTFLFWHDASEVVYYFNEYKPEECWDNEPDLMVDESVESFAMTDYNGTVQLCNKNTCPGDNLGVISKVELRVNGYHEGESGSIILRPVFNGENDGENYTYETPSGESAWSSWFDITNDEGFSSGSSESSSWPWSVVNGLMCDVEASFEEQCQLFCSMIEIRVTYNCVPVVSDPFPVHGCMDVVLCPLLNISVVDGEGDVMNITWYSNSTPSFLTLHPDGNGSCTQLSRYPTNYSANYMCVDETVVDDSDYVRWKGDSWVKDVYNLPDHGSESGVINSVVVYARCARIGSINFTDKVNSSAKIVIKTGGVYYYGDEFLPPYSPGSPPPLPYTNYSYVWTCNPATGDAWSWNDIDDLHAGIAFIGNYGYSCCTQLYVVVNYTNPSTWLVFGTNSSVGNGTYHQQFMNASVNGKWWYWKVMVDDGTTNVYSSVYKFYTGFQSKIVNTGSTNISGYLLIQVQFNNSGEWVLDDDTVNETSTSTVAIGGQLGLDTFFNGKVNTNDLSHGSGTYRVYAAFRDPDGDVLVCDDDSLLEAWYEFTVVFE
jgi:hypothetical protein